MVGIQHDVPFKPGRRVLRDYPWVQDNLGRKGPTKSTSHPFAEDFAGHSTERIHKFDIFTAQKNHTGLAQAVSGGLLGSGTARGNGDENPHKEHFESHYKQYAGVRSGSTGKTRKPAMSQKAVMDEIILGRDIDASGDNVHEEFMAVLTKDAAGCRSAPETGRARKPGLPVQDTMDKTVHGTTIAPGAKQAWLDRQRKSMIDWDETAAGMSRWEVAKLLANREKEREVQRRGTVVGGVVFGKDVAYDEHYEEAFGDIPGMEPCSPMRILARSTSTPSTARDRVEGGAPAAGQRRR